MYLGRLLWWINTKLNLVVSYRYTHKISRLSEQIRNEKCTKIVPPTFMNGDKI